MRAPTPQDFGFKQVNSSTVEWGWTKRGGYFMYHKALAQWGEVERTYNLLMDSTISPDLAKVYNLWYEAANQEFNKILIEWEHYDDKHPVIEPYSTDLKNDCKLSDVYLNKVADEAREVRKCGCSCQKVKNVEEEKIYKEYTAGDLDIMLEERDQAFGILSEIQSSRNWFLNVVKMNNALFDRITLLLIKKFSK